jgi:hypothetical protein
MGRERNAAGDRRENATRGPIVETRETRGTQGEDPWTAVMEVLEQKLHKGDYTKVYAPAFAQTPPHRRAAIIAPQAPPPGGICSRVLYITNSLRIIVRELRRGRKRRLTH